MITRNLVSLLLLTTILLASAACNLVITPPAPAQLTPNGVIFSAAQTKANLDVVWGDIEDTWTPTIEDVNALEAALPAFLQNAENQWLRPDPPIWERVPEYMRQYLGVVENGENVIHANFFCTVNETDWHNEYVFVMDGGDCFFQVKYNPATGEFFDFSVNGES